MSVCELIARRLDVILAREQADGRLPSVVGGLVRDGELVWTGAVSGLDGFETGPDVQYRIGSITKTLVAVCVLQLRDEGRGGERAYNRPAANLVARTAC